MSERPPRTPLLYPQRYFEHADDPLRSGLTVFAAYFLGNSVLLYLIVRGIFQRIQSPPAGLESQLSGMLLTIIVFAGILSCISLLVIAAVMHYGSGRSAAQRGEFSDAVSVAGWAYAPNAISIPVSYLLIRDQFSRLDLSASSPEALQAELEAVQTPGDLQILLTLVVVCWSIYILAYGTAETHRAELQDTLLFAFIIGLFALVGSFL